jgi:hypothetical protein
VCEYACVCNVTGCTILFVNNATQSFKTRLTGMAIQRKRIEMSSEGNVSSKHQTHFSKSLIKS